MALYILHSIFHLARLSYVRPETFGPHYVLKITIKFLQHIWDSSVSIVKRRYNRGIEVRFAEWVEISSVNSVQFGCGGPLGLLTEGKSG